MSDHPQQNPNLPPPYYFEEDTISLTDIMLILARHLNVIIITVKTENYVRRAQQ